MSVIHNPRHQKSQNQGSDRLSDEILIGCTVLQQPKQGHQHLIHGQQEPNNTECYEKVEKNDGKQRGFQNLHASGSFLQSYDPAPKHQNLLNSASHKNNQSTFSNQLQLIISNLQNKVCNSIEEAQPILRLCLNNVGANSISNLTQANQFTSILSDNEIDQNLVCPTCKFIVVNPVECQSCQYIICYKCAQKYSMTCFEQSCCESFTSQPGKIHKLYRAMLNQLEFRCPNQGAGCQSLLKYDQLDHHFKELCESRDNMCPNRCLATQKYSVAAMKEHLLNSCPKEYVTCQKYGERKQRQDMQNHLNAEYDQVETKCEKCDQIDLRIRFKDGNHDCISLLKDAINHMQLSTGRDEI